MTSIKLKEIRNITEESNVKLLFRHSNRESLKGVDDTLSISLTEEGILNAYNFGKNIHWNIGLASTSIAKRCIQTIEKIVEGSCSGHIDSPTGILTSPALFDFELAKKTFFAEGNLKNIARKLSMGQKLPGFYSAQITAEKLLDYIFSVGNESKTLDLFCTHDFNVVILLSYLMPSIAENDRVVMEWPVPLEGIYLWGERYDFNYLWKGKIFQWKKSIAVR